MRGIIVHYIYCLLLLSSLYPVLVLLRIVLFHICYTVTYLSAYMITACLISSVVNLSIRLLFIFTKVATSPIKVRIMRTREDEIVKAKRRSLMSLIRKIKHQ